MTARIDREAEARADAWTPGPWALGEEGSCFRLIHADGIVVADCDYEQIVGAVECDANARLIAAAPELVEALRCLLDDSHSYESEGYARDHARALLAKIGGAQ